MGRPSKQDDNGNVIFELNGFQIKPNTIYEVIEKLDSSAPDGFQEWSTSKVLSEKVVDNYPGAIFDVQRGVWDTGLHPTSRAFQSAVRNDLQDITLKRLHKYIVQPIEAEKGKGYLDHTEANNDRWDDFTIPVHKGKIFNTASPDDLLKLYLLTVHKKLTPKEMESHPEYKQPQSMYCVIDKEDSMDRKAERDMAISKANALFYDMLNSNKSDLVQVLDYLGMRINDSTPDASIHSMFKNYIESKEDKFQNYKIFIDAVEDFNTDEGKERIYIHHKIKSWYVDTKTRKVKKNSDGIYLDDVYVDKEWKSAARKIEKDPELKELFASLDV